MHSKCKDGLKLSHKSKSETATLLESQIFPGSSAFVDSGKITELFDLAVSTTLVETSAPGKNSELALTADLQTLVAVVYKFYTQNRTRDFY